MLRSGSSPVAYRIRYDVVDLENCRFEGSVEIDLICRARTDSITLHAKELHISAASVDGVAVESVSFNVEDERVTLGLKAFTAGECTLRIVFAGVLNSDLEGFYRSFYTDEKGVKRAMAVTQFEATAARRGFPCFDEPSLKATFALTVVAPVATSGGGALRVVSNMPLKSSRRCARPLLGLPGGEGIASQEVEFQTTPVMSTYLLGLCIGEFDEVATTTARGVPVRVLTPVGQSERGRFALDVATR